MISTRSFTRLEKQLPKNIVGRDVELFINERVLRHEFSAGLIQVEARRHSPVEIQVAEKKGTKYGKCGIYK